MKAAMPRLGALLLTVLLASSAYAQQCYPYIPQAPDMRGPGYYSANCCGTTYGPCYQVVPPYLPFQGMVPAPKSKEGEKGAAQGKPAWGSPPGGGSWVPEGPGSGSPGMGSPGMGPGGKARRGGSRKAPSLSSEKPARDSAKCLISGF